MSERHHDLSFAESTMHILSPYELKKPLLQKKTTLVLIHPPKTAGTNLSFYMTALSKRDPDFSVERLAVPRIANQSPNLIYQDWKGGLKGAEDILSKNPNALNDFSFLSGHMPVGLDSMVNTPCKYIGLVRDPVQREISSLNFDYQRAYISKEEASEYLRLTMIDNPQTRMLAGSKYFQGDCTEKTLEIAIENIEKSFLFIAPAFASFEAVQTLAAIYNQGAVALSKSQVTGIKLIETPSDELHDFLSKKHSLDVKLYEYVKTHWNNWKNENVSSTVELQGTGSVLALTPQFATTKEPEIMTVSSIQNYNHRTKNQPLVSVSQQSDIKQIHP